MRRILFCFACAITCSADTIEAFGYKWTIPLSKDWRVDSDNGTEVLRMLVARPQESPRRPTQFAIAETPVEKAMMLEAEVKRNGGSLILVYAYKDPSHFNYAHLSVDEGTKQPVHNGIFHVYGGERVRISQERGPAALPNSDWHRVRLTYDSTTGIVAVTVNGQSNRALEAVDLSLGAGKMGIGSFFERASFRNVKISAARPD